MGDMVYRWKPEARISIDPQVAGEHLALISKRNDGQLTPGLVVEDAREPASPLHPCFEWDETKAAELWREDQARYILRHVVVMVKLNPANEESTPMRALVAVSYESKERTYVPIQVVMADPELRAQALLRAWKELQGWRERYREYKEFAAVFGAIEEVKPQLAIAI